MHKRVRGMVLACVVALLLILAPLVVQAASQGTASEATVKLLDQPVFEIATRGHFSSVAERAQRIEQRLKVFADRQAIPLEDLKTHEGDGGTLVYADDSVLVFVSDADAKAAGIQRNLLAQRYLDAIRTAVRTYRDVRSVEYLTRAWAIALLSTFILFILLMILLRLMPRFYQWLNEQHIRRFPSIRIQNLELISSSQLSAMLLELTELVRLVAVIGFFYAYLSFVFNLFPATQNYSLILLGYVAKALQFSWKAFIGYLPNLIVILLIWIATSYIIRFLKLVFSGLSHRAFTIRGFYPEWAEPTYRLVSILAVALAVAIGFPFLPGSSSPAFQGVSIFLGALVSLGATGAVANIVGGYVLIYTRAFQVGDRVKIGETLGDIEEKLMLVTRVRTLNNILVTIPNASLLNSNIVNYTALLRDNQIPPLLSTTVTLGYDIPWRKIHAALIEAAFSTPDILQEPAPFILQTALNDFYVSYELKAATQHPERMLQIYSALHQNIQDKCNEAGIEICSPHYAALRDGNTSTIPAPYWPADYQPARFQIDTTAD